MKKKDELFYKELVHTNMLLGDIRKLLELERKRHLQKDLTIKGTIKS